MGGEEGSSATPQHSPGAKGAHLTGRFSRQLKRHPGLIPLIGFIGLGLGSAALYLLRLAIFSPDVSLELPLTSTWADVLQVCQTTRQPLAKFMKPFKSWDRKNNPEPWNKLSPNDQYKFMAVSTDYKNLKKDRPDF